MMSLSDKTRPRPGAREREGGYASRKEKDEKLHFAFYICMVFGF